MGRIRIDRENGSFIIAVRPRPDDGTVREFGRRVFPARRPKWNGARPRSVRWVFGARRDRW